MDPGLACEEDIPPDPERRVDGALRAQSADLQRIASMGAASKKRGILETVQYRRKPTFLQYIRTKYKQDK
jgi:hypothetical protein